MMTVSLDRKCEYCDLTAEFVALDTERNLHPMCPAHAKKAESQGWRTCSWKKFWLIPDEE
jgi:hypothetical protein